MIRIAIVLASTRPGRRGEAVARWAVDFANHSLLGAQRAHFDLVDLALEDLPPLDEPAPAKTGRYEWDHTQRWAQTIASYDGFVFVTPEYNHSVPAPLKSAIDYLYAEWSDKAAGFISYGLDGGTRAVEHLRLVLSELKVATVRAQTTLYMFHDFEVTDPVQTGRFTPRAHQDDALEQTLTEVVEWSSALRQLREPTSADALLLGPGVTPV